MTREELAQYDDARRAIFNARLDRYRDRENDLPSEAEDMYDPDVPTPLDYREMRDDWPPYPPPPPRPRVTMRDETLPHQIVIFAISSQIAVSCNCLRGIDGTQAHYSPLEVRYRWEPDEPMRIWRAHMAALKTEASRG